MVDMIRTHSSIELLNAVDLVAMDFDGIMCSRNGNVERCRPAFTSFIEFLLSELNFYYPESIDETPH